MKNRSSRMGSLCGLVLIASFFVCADGAAVIVKTELINDNIKKNESDEQPLLLNSSPSSGLTLLDFLDHAKFGRFLRRWEQQPRALRVRQRRREQQQQQDQREVGKQDEELQQGGQLPSRLVALELLDPRLVQVRKRREAEKEEKKNENKAGVKENQENEENKGGTQGNEENKQREENQPNEEKKLKEENQENEENKHEEENEENKQREGNEEENKQKEENEENKQKEKNEENKQKEENEPNKQKEENEENKEKEGNKENKQKEENADYKENKGKVENKENEENKGKNQANEENKEKEAQKENEENKQKEENEENKEKEENEENKEKEENEENKGKEENEENKGKEENEENKGKEENEENKGKEENEENKEKEEKKGNNEESKDKDAENKGEDAENKGKDAENKGEGAENKGKDAENKGENAENKGNNAENKGENAENKGKDAENKGEDAENKGKDAENKGEDAENKGKDAENKGEDAENKGEDEENKGKGKKKKTSKKDNSNDYEEISDGNADGENSGNDAGQNRLLHITPPAPMGEQKAMIQVNDDSVGDNGRNESQGGLVQTPIIPKAEMNAGNEDNEENSGANEENSGANEGDADADEENSGANEENSGANEGDADALEENSGANEENSGANEGDADALEENSGALEENSGANEENSGADEENSGADKKDANADEENSGTNEENKGAKEEGTENEESKGANEEGRNEENEGESEGTGLSVLKDVAERVEELGEKGKQTMQQVVGSALQKAKAGGSTMRPSIVGNSMEVTTEVGQLPDIEKSSKKNGKQNGAGKQPGAGKGKGAGKQPGAGKGKGAGKKGDDQDLSEAQLGIQDRVIETETTTEAMSRISEPDSSRTTGKSIHKAEALSTPSGTTKSVKVSADLDESEKFPVGLYPFEDKALVASILHLADYHHDGLKTLSPVHSCDLCPDFFLCHAMNRSAEGDASDHASTQNMEVDVDGAIQRNAEKEGEFVCLRRTLALFPCPEFCGKDGKASADDHERVVAEKRQALSLMMSHQHLPIMEHCELCLRDSFCVRFDNTNNEDLGRNGSQSNNVNPRGEDGGDKNVTEKATVGNGKEGILGKTNEDTAALDSEEDTLTFDYNDDVGGNDGLGAHPHVCVHQSLVDAFDDPCHELCSLLNGKSNCRISGNKCVPQTESTTLPIEPGNSDLGVATEFVSIPDEEIVTTEVPHPDGDHICDRCLHQGRSCISLGENDEVCVSDKRVRGKDCTRLCPRVYGITEKCDITPVRGLNHVSCLARTKRLAGDCTPCTQQNKGCVLVQNYNAACSSRPTCGMCPRYSRCQTKQENPTVIVCVPTDLDETSGLEADAVLAGDRGEEEDKNNRNGKKNNKKDNDTNNDRVKKAKNDRNDEKSSATAAERVMKFNEVVANAAERFRLKSEDEPVKADRVMRRRSEKGRRRSQDDEIREWSEQEQ